MFCDYPSVEVATDLRKIDRNFEEKNVAGCVEAKSPAAITHVEIDLQALLRIVKHSNERRREQEFGSLAGVQLGPCVEVTNVLPKLNRERRPFYESEEEQVLREQREKEQDLIESAAQLAQRDALLDTNQVGVYTIASCDRFLNPAQIKVLVSLADRNCPAVLLNFDKQRTELGALYLKAFTFTEKFMESHRSLPVNARPDETIRALRSHGVYEHGVLRELPVRIRCSLEQQLLLRKMVPTPKLPSVSRRAGDPETTQYIEKLLSAVSRNLHDLGVVVRDPHTRWDHGCLSVKLPTLLTLEATMGQARHLEAVCDSALMNIALAKKLAG